jgi:protein-disulfide isomerase
MLDSLMFGNKLADTLQIVRMAKNLGMDLKQFNKDLNDPGASSRLEYNFKLLKAYGIYATPTILINGKPVFDSSSMVEIENQIKSELLTTSK